MTGLLIAGTTSDAGKSLVTTGLCRWLRRQGVRVAPFKAQNMSNNSMVCGPGQEIGRAQWVQAIAAGVEPEPAMNPVLLKPGSDRSSHVVLMGKPWGTLHSGEWATGRRELAAAAFEAYEDLASRFDVVIAEGAGSPAEVNLREGDYVNMGLAAAKDLPVAVVGDIDRGGVLAAMVGTWTLLEPADQSRIVGWVVNKFRGDEAVLRPGLRVVEERTGTPMWGVLPWMHDVWIDGEDALTLGSWRGTPTSGASTLTVAAVGFPRLSNGTDLDAIALEPGVDLVVARTPAAIANADVVIVPGTRATLHDLEWMRARGLDLAITYAAAQGTPVVGICGGYQMLANTLTDPDGVEAGAGTTAPGLGLLPVSIRFDATKTLDLVEGEWGGHLVRGYEIHHGVATVEGGGGEPFLDGVTVGAVWGTHWHGVFENDGFRRAFLRHCAQLVGADWRPQGGTSFVGAREAMIDRVADHIDMHLDTHAVLRVLKLA